MGGGGSKDVSLLGLSMQTKHGPYGLATEKELREALSKSGGGAGGKADKTGWSPIMYASFNGNESAVSLLLEAGTQVSPGDSKGPCCPLHIAAAADEGGIVTILLQANADPNCLACQHPGFPSLPPLHLACMNGAESSLVALLQDHRTELDYCDDAVESALHCAARNGHAECCSQLVERGASPLSGTVSALSLGKTPEVRAALVSATVLPMLKDMTLKRGKERAALLTQLETVLAETNECQSLFQAPGVNFPEDLAALLMQTTSSSSNPDQPLITRTLMKLLMQIAQHEEAAALFASSAQVWPPLLEAAAKRVPGAILFLSTIGAQSSARLKILRREVILPSLSRLSFPTQNPSPMPTLRPSGEFISLSQVYLDLVPRSENPHSQIFSASIKRTKACAKVLVDSATQDCIDSFLFEGDVLATVSHPNVLTFVGRSEKREEDVTRPTLLVELMELSLRSYIHDKDEDGKVGVRDPAFVAHVLLSVANALSYFHKQGIAHGRVQSSNVFLSGSMPRRSHVGQANSLKAKLGSVAGSYRMRHIKTSTECRCLAPELLEGNSTQAPEATFASDVFGFGILMYELVTGSFPFHRILKQSEIMHTLQVPPDVRSPTSAMFNLRASAEFRASLESKNVGEIASPGQIRAAIVAGQRPRLPAQVPREHAELMAKCWAQHPDQRPSMEEVAAEIATWKCSCDLCAFVVNPLRQSTKRRVRRPRRREGLTHRAQEIRSQTRNSVTFISKSDMPMTESVRQYRDRKSKSKRARASRVEVSQRAVSMTRAPKIKPSRRTAGESARRHGRQSQLAVLQL